jgi:2-polyprenyl-3-methyl-5-hydroxy-6-metoxy-1,4-benzoquinol methylase
VEADATDTSGRWYAKKLEKGTSRWKLSAANPYRLNLRSMKLGRVLDVGCGIGRCLLYLDGNGVGIDHNPTSVSLCRSRGLEVYLPEEFEPQSAGQFDSILLSHVLEHMEWDDGIRLIEQYLPLLQPGGRLVLITPQAAGQKSDPTHVRPFSRHELSEILGSLGATAVKTRSFPFPDFAGSFFVHNENHAVGVF